MRNFGNGKTRTRPLVLIDSIPYLKDYLDHEHPRPGNPNVKLFSGYKKYGWSKYYQLRRHVKTKLGIWKVFLSNSWSAVVLSSCAWTVGAMKRVPDSILSENNVVAIDIDKSNS